jgi:ABC-type polysaccharide/polyol phosphate export permease
LPRHLREEKAVQVAAGLYLLREWTRRDFRIKYTQTMLGSFWALAQPVALTAAFVFLFQSVASVDVGIPYVSYVFPAMLMWTLFATGVTSGTGAMLTSMGIASKAKYPRIIAPISSALLPLADFALALLFVPILFLIQKPDAHVAPLAFISSLMGCLLLSAAVGTFLSALTVFVRDVRNVVPLVLQMGLLITPVAYPSSRLPGWLVYSPIATFVEGFRASLVASPYPSLARWLFAFGATTTCLLLATLYFHRVEGRFPDVA